MKTILLATALVSAGGVAQALPPTVNANLTVRDFSTRSFKPFYNPNFEKLGPISGLETGIVDVNLPGTKLPTFDFPPPIAVPGGGPSSVTNPADFAEWWSPTVDGAPNNAPFLVPITLTLTDTIPVTGGVLGQYTFSDTSFFPVDGGGSGGGVPSQGTGGYYGNEARTHNYGFTAQVNTTFDYQPGVAFSFSGDDDLWVFVNNKLVLDLGGVHPPTAGGFLLGPATTDVSGALLGLVPGTTYDIDFYYAERHTAASNLEFQYTIFERDAVPESGTLVPSLTFGAGMAFLALRRRRQAAQA